MAKRVSGKERAIGVTVLICLLALAFPSVRNAFGVVILIAICGGLIGLAALYANKYAKRKARLQYLTSKYSDAEIVKRILQRHLWPGETAEQVIDSFGEAESKDDKLLKTIKREVWKYYPMGVNRYSLRITLDNGLVTAWDRKE